MAMKHRLRGVRLHTVCEEARCPNIGECWSRGTATFMVLGDVCTRHCGFCSVTSGAPLSVDSEEPSSLAGMIRSMRLRHVVITMVARDDLADGGAGHLAEVIESVRQKNPETRIEVLTSDFQGDSRAIQKVVEAAPDIFNHNIETVERLSLRVRHRATYRRSLEVLKEVRESSRTIRTKSGLMLGLGEQPEEICQALKDLRRAGCELLTIGQYLRPTLKNLPVVEYLRPEIFEQWRKTAEEFGFQVASGPFVRSSYHAEEMACLPEARVNG